MLTDGAVIASDIGTPQGGAISPLLANIYLHYALDLWVARWRRRCRADVIIVRYADDFVLGFQYRNVAVRFRAELEERLRGFGLEVHPEKTRLIEFGRFACTDRRARGEGKPSTFEFLGFTHYCSHTRHGVFTIKRRTSRTRLQAKLKEIKELLRVRRHSSVPEVGLWLRSVLRGHYRYYGVPHNSRALSCFYDAVCRHWRRALSRRSQKGYVNWERMRRLKRTWLVPPRICHDHPNKRLLV